MEIYTLNPFIRYAQVQPALLNGDTFRMGYDCRLFYVLKGEGQLILENETYDLSPSSAVYLPPATPYRVSGKMRVISLNYDLTHTCANRKRPLGPPPVEEYDPSLQFETEIPAELALPFCVTNSAFIDVQIKNVVSEFQFLGMFSELRTSAILKQILCDLLQQHTAPRTPGLQLVNQAIGYILRHYQRRITNEEIAAAVGYNPLYLNRVFKQYTGLTMHYYVNRERIKTASQMLRNTTLSIEAIGEECGYESRSHFCTTFHQFTGMSPLTFRNSTVSIAQLLDDDSLAIK